MARILFGSNPLSGHVRPGLPVAAELVSRGHEVVWYTGAAFRDAIERTGARHVGVTHGLDFDEAHLEATFPGRAAARAGIPQLKYDLRHVFLDPIAGQLRDLRALADAEPFDVVVAESTFAAGAWLAEERGLELAVYGIVPLMSRSRDTAPTGLALTPARGPLGRLRNRVLHTMIEDVVFGPEQRYAQTVRARVGLPPSRSSLFQATADAATVFLQGTVPDFEYPRTDLPDTVRFVGALVPSSPASTPLPAWWDELDGDRPVVLVTQGTVKVDPEHLLHPAIEALADEDVLVVATTGGLDPAPILARHDADNVRLETFIPFADLLPHVDVVVTNGGYGGTQQALMHGIPVVVAGVTEGKNEVAARVRWTGTGIDLRTDAATPGQVRTSVRTLLRDGSYRARAERLAAAYARHDGPRTAADLVEGLLERTPALPGVTGR
jgi:MGT family glycosyltransferase